MMVLAMMIEPGDRLLWLWLCLSGSLFMLLMGLLLVQVKSITAKKRIHATRQLTSRLDEALGQFWRHFKLAFHFICLPILNLSFEYGTGAAKSKMVIYSII